MTTQTRSRPSALVRKAKRALAMLASVVAVYGMLALDGNAGLPVGFAQARAEQIKPQAFNRGAMATFVFKKTLKKLPDLSFRDAAGKERSLKDWRGKIVLLNLWATWCGPCRKEMPALDRLNGALGGKDFELVAVSIDRKGAAAAQAFLDEIKVDTIKLYIDQTAKISRHLRAFGLPYTFLVDREGREIGRLVGPAEWDSDEAKRLINAAINARLSNQKPVPTQ